MSDRLALLVWTQYPAGGAELLTLLAIAEACNEQGNCYCNVAALAASARMSRRSAQRGVNQLRDDRWIVTDRMPGRGGRLVMQLNLPLLTRSCRPGHDETAMHTQRVRDLGATEAGLAERLQPRLPESQSVTPSDAANLSPTATVSQSVTAPDWHSAAVDAPHDASEETTLSRQEKQTTESGPNLSAALAGAGHYARLMGESRGGRAEYEAAANLLLDDGGSICDRREDDFRGAGVPDDAHGALYGAPTASDETLFSPIDPALLFDDDFSQDELASLEAAAERRQNRGRQFTPRPR